MPATPVLICTWRDQSASGWYVRDSAGGAGWPRGVPIVPGDSVPRTASSVRAGRAMGWQPGPDLHSRLTAHAHPLHGCPHRMMLTQQGLVSWQLLFLLLSMIFRGRWYFLCQKKKKKKADSIFNLNVKTKWGPKWNWLAGASVQAV